MKLILYSCIIAVTTLVLLVPSCATKPDADNFFAIRGTVENENSDPIEQAAITMVVTGIPTHLESDDNGWFEVTFVGGDSLVIGLSVSAEGYVSSSDSLVIKESETDLNIVLDKQQRRSKS